MASVTPLPSFPNFPLLPFEIRLKIWEYCLPQPRLIKIKDAKVARQQDDDPVLKAVPCHCAALCDVYPPVAAVSWESRAVFLAHFTFCFGTHISWKNDTIYLTWDLSYQARLSDSRARRVLDTFVATILACPGGAQMASLAMDAHDRWVNLVLCDAENPRAVASTSLFDRFPNMKEFLAIHGTIGIFKLLQSRTWPHYDVVPGPGKEVFRSGSYEICMPADASSNRSRDWPPVAGMKLVEASSSDEDVWKGDPTYVARDFVREIYEDGGWGGGGGEGAKKWKPPVKIVAARVHTGSCFKDWQPDTTGFVDGQGQMREDIVFQKNEQFTC